MKLAALKTDYGVKSGGAVVETLTCKARARGPGFDLGFCQFSFRDLVSPASKSQYD